MSSLNGVDNVSENGKSGDTSSANESYRGPALPNVQISDRDVDIIRIIGQYLRDMGLHSSVERLMKESGLRLDHPAAFSFREHILNGSWNRAEQDLDELYSLLTSPDYMLKMKFLLLEQKYLELLESGSAVEALDVLQNQLTPLKYNVQRVHQLTSYVMCSGADELRKQAGWSGSTDDSRRRLLLRLQSFLPASVMVPPARLRMLLHQALQLQCSRCRYHNTDSSFSDRISLLADHACTQEDFPSVTAQVLTEHDDEVWFCKFSPDGNSLASGSKDGTILVWDVDQESFSAQLRHTLLGPIDGSHEFAVCYLSWSPDSRFLLAAHESPDVFIWDAVRGSLEKSIVHNSSDTILCACWHPSGDRFVCGGTHGQFYLYDIRGTLLDRWEGVRVRALAFMRDGSSILAADTHNRVCSYKQGEPRPQELLTESTDVMSMSVNDTGVLAALNVANQGVHLWDLQDRVLIRKFQGVTQGTFTVHSCFGGVNENFIASGSEENSVYVWNTEREKPVAVLSGHSSTVSCVSWNPRQPAMLASCSDDSTVRIWAPAAIAARHNKNTNNNNICSPSNNGTSNELFNTGASNGVDAHLQ